MKRNKEYKTGTYYYCMGKRLIEVNIVNEGDSIILTEDGITEVLPPESCDIETIHETKEEALNAHIEEAKFEIGVTLENIKHSIKDVSKYMRLLGISYFRKIMIIAKEMRL